MQNSATAASDRLNAAFVVKYFMVSNSYQNISCITWNQFWEGYFGNLIGYRLQVTSNE